MGWRIYDSPLPVGARAGRPIVVFFIERVKSWRLIVGSGQRDRAAR